MNAEKLKDLFTEAEEICDVDPNSAVAKYEAIITSNPEKQGEKENKIKEDAILALGKLFVKNNRPNDVANLLVSIRPFFTIIPKAKTAKIVWSLINLLSDDSNSLELQIKLCIESIDWCIAEKRTFLRHRIQSKLASLYAKAKKYFEAIDVITTLLKEVKRLDDKALLVEIHLVESQVQHSLKNIPKSRTALTSARTAANAIYCPPLMQGQIDMQSGTLHAEEKDYKTGYSYFYEAFEGYNSLDNPIALTALKYMLLCKIMIHKPEDVNAVLTGKIALKYAGRAIESMRAIADAHKSRSLADFNRALADFSDELQDDPLIKSHLAELYDTMLQQNLCRIIEPFSRVEIQHVADLIGLNIELVEKKLSQMILDKKFNGILDQGNGCLILFSDEDESRTYGATLETINGMSKVVDLLYEKLQKLN